MSGAGSHRLLCDFCGGKKPFKDLKQVPLKIDKTSRVQYLFGFICSACSAERRPAPDSFAMNSTRRTRARWCR